VTESGSVGVGPAPSEVVRGMAGSVMSMAPSDGVVVVRALSTLSPSTVVFLWEWACSRFIGHWCCLSGGRHVMSGGHFCFVVLCPILPAVLVWLVLWVRHPAHLLYCE
jgi:hypothetical protein